MRFESTGVASQLKAVDHADPPCGTIGSSKITKGQLLPLVASLNGIQSFATVLTSSTRN